MFFRQYYLGCLSHASYLIGDTTTGRAVVVDPQRDVAEYLADAEAMIERARARSLIVTNVWALRVIVLLVLLTGVGIGYLI